MKNKMLQMLKLTLVFWLTSSITGVYAQVNCSELFFSEYIEGSSNNKALEIYNPSMSTIDLSNYSIKIFANGSASANVTIPLSGMIASYSVFVITHTSATPNLLNNADLTSGSLSFNGDDAVVLVSTTDTVDIIGIIGTDPGSSWSNNGVSTANQTILRNFAVQIGIGNDSTNFDPSIEFTSLGLDDFTNIGIHTSSCSSSSCTATSDTIIREFCSGDTITFNGDEVTTTGIYYDSLQSLGGCDSVIVYNLIFNNAVSYTSTVTIDAFGSELQLIITDTTGGTVLNVTSGFPDGQSGNTYSIEHCLSNPCINYYLFDAAGDGMDSPASVTVTDASSTTVLQVLDTDFNNDLIGFVLCNSTPCTATSDTIIREFCSGDTITFNGDEVTTTGIYYDSLQSLGGCDSVIVYNLIFNNAVSYTSTVTIDAFGSELQLIITDTTGGTVLNVTSGFPDGQSGNTYSIEHCLSNPCINYYLFDAAGDGMDSPASVTVTDASSTTVLQVLDTDFNNDLIGFVLCNSTPCTATSDTTNQNVCMGDSLVFGGQTVIATGIYYDSLQSIGGCDSVIVLSLTVNPLPTIIAMVSEDTVCSGQDVILYGQGGLNYIWDNNVTDSVATVVSQTTTYYILGEDANGCVNEDSITVVVTSDSVPEILIFTADSLLCDGEGTSFSSLVANAGQNFTYQWKRNGNNVGTGLATYNSQAPSTNDGDIITCVITTTNSCVSAVISNSITISVGTIDTVSVTETICVGDT